MLNNKCEYMQFMNYYTIYNIQIRYLILFKKIKSAIKAELKLYREVCQIFRETFTDQETPQLYYNWYIIDSCQWLSCLLYLAQE